MRKSYDTAFKVKGGDRGSQRLDNVYVERPWRPKYEDIYLNWYESLGELHGGVERYFRFYNTEPFHQGLGYRTPDECLSVISI